MGQESQAGRTNRSSDGQPQAADGLLSPESRTYTYAHRFHVDSALNAAARAGEPDLRLLLSDQCPFVLKIVWFQGDDATAPSEHSTISGSVLEQFSEGMKRLKSVSDADMASSEPREAPSDAPQARWPEPALRESLLNAIEHRDYSYSGPTLINIFTTRIEIISLGALVGDLQVSDLLNGICQPRNPALVEVFESLGWAQNCGSGILRIMDSYQASVISPQVRVASSSVAALLPAPVPMDQDLRQTGHDHRFETAGSGDPQESEFGDGIHSARRYTFPVPTPHTTHDASVALAGMRVIGSRPMQIATLGKQEQGWAFMPIAAAGDDTDGMGVTTHLPTDAPIAVPVALPASQPLVGLEEVTLHVLARAGVPLSRAQIQNSLGLSKHQAAHLLHTLSKQGRINVEGRSRATRYFLP